jgi:hypothetical protein
MYQVGNLTNLNKTQLLNMKKHSKTIIIIGSLIGLFFIIKSRRVSQSTFDFMVQHKKYEILGVCSNRLRAKLKDSNLKFDNISSDNKEFYNYILSVNGDDLCSNPTKLNQVVTDHYKKFFKEEWNFIF